MKCHKTTVKRWLDRWKQTKDLTDRARQGRSRVTTAKDDQLIVNLVQQDEDEGITSKRIQQELQLQGVNASVRTVQRRLVEAGFRYSRPLSKPLLTEEHQRDRLKWARSMKNYDWDKVIISDEASIHLHAVRKFF
jgi:transposase